MTKTIVVTARRGEWEHAQKSGEYAQSTVDSTLEEVGFIHATFPEQVMAMVNRRYSDQDDLVLLLVDADKVKAEIKYEGALSGRAGTFPHIYGPLNADAVYKYLPLRKGNDGRFETPAALPEGNSH